MATNEQINNCCGPLCCECVAKIETLESQLSTVTAERDEALYQYGIWKTTSDAHAKVLIEYEDRAKLAEAENEKLLDEVKASRMKLDHNGVHMIVYSSLDVIDPTVTPNYVNARAATDSIESLHAKLKGA